jgi:hypothetical protein
LHFRLGEGIEHTRFEKESQEISVKKMMKATSIVVLGFFAAASIGCTSTPRQPEAPMQEAEIAAVEADDRTEPMIEDTVSTSTMSADDLSLGAASSGRGH